MSALKDVAPDVVSQFEEGKFVVHKTSRNFSGIPIDQAHEKKTMLWLKEMAELWGQLRMPVLCLPGWCLGQRCQESSTSLKPV